MSCDTLKHRKNFHQSASLGIQVFRASHSHGLTFNACIILIWAVSYKGCPQGLMCICMITKSISHATTVKDIQHFSTKAIAYKEDNFPRYYTISLLYYTNHSQTSAILQNEPGSTDHLIKAFVKALDIIMMYPSAVCWRDRRKLCEAYLLSAWQPVLSRISTTWQRIRDNV